MTTPATAGGLTTEGTLALVVERLDDLRREMREGTTKTDAAIESLRAELQQQRQAYVPRPEWERRNLQIDERTAGLGREIRQLRAELASKRLSWPAVAGGVGGIVSVAIVIITYIVT